MNTRAEMNGIDLSAIKRQVKRGIKNTRLMVSTLDAISSDTDVSFNATCAEFFEAIDKFETSCAEFVEYQSEIY